MAAVFMTSPAENLTTNKLTPRLRRRLVRPCRRAKHLTADDLAPRTCVCTCKTEARKKKGQKQDSHGAASQIGHHKDDPSTVILQDERIGK